MLSVAWEDRERTLRLALQQKGVLCTDSVSTRTRSKLSRSQDASSTVDASVSTEAVNGASNNKVLTAITRHLKDSPLYLKAVLCKLPQCFEVLSRARNLELKDIGSDVYKTLETGPVCTKSTCHHGVSCLDSCL